MFKQGLGGLNFILLSYFLKAGKVPVVDGLSGFRYVFLLIFTLILGYNFRHILDEAGDKGEVKQKIIAVALIFLGTLILSFA